MTDPNPDAVEQSALPRVETIGHLMVVPRTTGPLADVDATGRPADELDAAIDEVFGETTDARPGPFDAVLVAGGSGVAVWALVTSAQGPLLFIGIVTALLGVALPARSLARAGRRRRQVAKRRRAIGDGLPLDVSHPATRGLADAYAACLEAAALPGAPHAGEAADAAHLAVVEVASLLAGGQPVAAEEDEYIRKRTKAIRHLTLQLERAHRVWVEARMDASIHVTPTDRQWASAVTRAREELESTTGLGSLDRLSGIGAALEREADDAVG